MSTAALPVPYRLESNLAAPTHEPRAEGEPRKGIRRRGNLEQGFALETLGHAVEYLVDSRLFAQSEAEAKSDAEAVQLLMRMSRAVFAECPEVFPLHRRLRRWIAGQR